MQRDDETGGRRGDGSIKALEDLLKPLGYLQYI
jgi:hypothetical protein